MATLILPYPAFTAGTPAVAAEVQDNFTTIRDHINGQNIGTANLENTLVSRVGGPILFLNQASQEQIALSILNSRTKSALQITQSAVLGAGSSIIHIDDNATQTTGSANLFLDLQPLSTIPAILVKHGAVETMSLTKDQLDLYASAVQITAADLISNKPLTLNTQSAGLSLKLKGRLSDNESQIQFKSNDDATEQARLTSQPTKLIANVPTGSTYEIKINDVDKVVIDNDGIDGQYLTNTSIAKGKMVAVGQQIATPANFTLNNSSAYVDVAGATVTITTTGRPVLVMIDVGMWRMTNLNSGWENNEGYLKLIRDSTDLKVYKNRIVATDSNSYSAGLLLIESPMSAIYFDAVVAGTYTYKLQAAASYQANPGQLVLQDIRLIAYEL